MKVLTCILFYLFLGANAIVVIVAAGISAILLSYNIDKLSITGHIKSGLPPVQLPKFSVSDTNTTISADEIFKVCKVQYNVGSKKLLVNKNVASYF